MKDHTTLNAWKIAREVAIESATICRRHWHPAYSAKFSQLTRAALSVRLNIAEGYAFMNTPTFRRHLDIAYGSAVETGEAIEHAIATEMLPPSEGAKLLEKSKVSQRLTYGLLLYVKRQQQPKKD